MIWIARLQASGKTPSKVNSSCESVGREDPGGPENIPSAPGSGSPDCLSRAATSAVKVAPADVPKIPMLWGL